MSKFYKVNNDNDYIIESESITRERTIYMSPTQYMAWTNPVLGGHPPIDSQSEYIELTEEEVFLLLL